MLPIPTLAPTDPPQALPPVSRALAEPNGLLAIGGSLSPDWLVHAYRQGAFPWFGRGQPILWWSPDPRAVLFPAEFRRARSLRRSIRSRGYETRLDGAFDEVLTGCAAPRAGQPDTWITAAMRRAYGALNRLGLAHSVETWRDGQLVGGLYGVALGGVFFGESMFSRDTDASKVALSRLVDECLARGVELIDCQQPTDHLASLGSRPIPRAEFTSLLERLADPARDLWRP
ncbi:MAG: leucyl/phenylalanyl-tRNA--protein transferase [Steroidobacteraceae bacterium]|jgi:leucyl/phenylalanyl-tRNA--protein transferase|nr:leucyl/phenylalanyl-tRNA--protein transferase [Steroidobacteraceae bacterium]